MPRLPPVQSHETYFNQEAKPGEIIEHIVRAARRRWSSAILIDNLPSPTTEQQASKSINISVKR